MFITEFKCDKKRVAVYLITDEWLSYFKIGVAENPHRRLRELQIGNPKKLIIQLLVWFPTRDMARAVERAMHERFAEFNTSGEWFDGSEFNFAFPELASFGIFVRAGGGARESPLRITQEHWAVGGKIYPPPQWVRPQEG